MHESLHAYNPGQNIWNKIDESSKTGQDKKRLISTFSHFLNAIAKFNFWKGVCQSLILATREATRKPSLIY